MHADADRLLGRLAALAEIGDTGDGGCCRLALTDEDRRGRDLVVAWMRDLDLSVSIDAIGNVVALWDVGEGAPVMTGSHIDTVRTGGRYDGNYGVLAGLEVIETLKQAGVTPDRPLAVAFFTDEEGARFAPDMLGSLVFVGGMPLEEALDIEGIDGARLGDELERIGYAGPLPCPSVTPHAYVELHIEQGPVLEAEGVTIGAVTGVQGISWQELTITGQPNHAGTTPMDHRHDPAYVAAELIASVRRLAIELGGHQVGTVGRVRVHPDLVNVVPASATIAVDLRNTEEPVLQEAERRDPCSRRPSGAWKRGATSWPRQKASRSPGAAWPGSSPSPSTSGWSTSSRPRRNGSATPCGACPRAPATTRRCWPGSARPAWCSCRAARASATTRPSTPTPTTWPPGSTSS
jgi:N-carbamoyl-L-amino-acid hydrolase